MKLAVWVGLFLVVGCTSTPEAPESPLYPTYDDKSDFILYDKDSLDTRYKLGAEYEALTRRLFELQDLGWNVTCARQVSDEIHWLLKSTADFQRAALRIQTLSELLQKDHSETTPESQSKNEGTWGSCYTEWFWRVVESSEYLLDLDEQSLLPKYHPAFLDRLNSPERLKAYLDSRLISNVARNGVNHRRELNESVSAVMRLILKKVPQNYKYHPDLKKTLLKYMDEKWQNKETGFWGAWFQSNNRIIKTNDLSMTFHIVKYRKGKVNHLDKMVRTLMAIKNKPYPFGWRTQEGVMTNHHNYDVVRLFRHGWKYLTAREKEAARGDIREMLDWCLSRSLQTDGTFRVSESDDSLGDSYYFGVAFLNEVGFFHYKDRFWTQETFRSVDTIRTAIRENLLRIENRDEKMKQALEILRDSYNLKPGEKLQPVDTLTPVQTEIPQDALTPQGPVSGDEPPPTPSPSPTPAPEEELLEESNPFN